jgi:CHAT domain-containing protein
MTVHQMGSLYRKLQTLPSAEALRQAQPGTIHYLKAEYGGVAPPMLWAPFILQGARTGLMTWVSMTARVRRRAHTSLPHIL